MATIVSEISLTQTFQVWQRATHLQFCLTKECHAGPRCACAQAFAHHTVVTRLPPPRWVSHATPWIRSTSHCSSPHRLSLFPAIPPPLSKGLNSCNTFIGRKSFTWRLLVCRIVGEQSVCLAGRYARKYYRQPTGSGRLSKQLHLRHRDHRNLWLER